MASPSDNSRMDNNCFKNIFNLQIQHKSLCIIGSLLFVFYTCTGNYLHNKDFDYIIFSQRWLPSACIHYEENNSSAHHQCVLPENYDFWAIHGLWPTKDKTLGPFFCNYSIKFDINALSPIIASLKTYWPNIEKGKSQHSLWKHEWLKHGTCLAQLEPFKQEFEYFNASLGLFQQFNLKSLFYSNKFVPSNDLGYHIMDIFNVVKNAFGKNPHLNCITEVKTKQAYLSEIRICFTKTLELMDCEEVNNNNDKKFKLSKTITNCPMNSLVMLPSKIDISPNRKSSLTQHYETMRYYDALLNFLNVLRFLQWASI